LWSERQLHTRKWSFTVYLNKILTINNYKVVNNFLTVMITNLKA